MPETPGEFPVFLAAPLLANQTSKSGLEVSSPAAASIRQFPRKMSAQLLAARQHLRTTLARGLSISPLLDQTFEAWVRVLLSAMPTHPLGSQEDMRKMTTSAATPK